MGDTKFARQITQIGGKLSLKLREMFLSLLAAGLADLSHMTVGQRLLIKSKNSRKDSSI